MGLGATGAAVAVAGASAAAGLAGSAIQAGAAGSAASKQAQAAREAAALQQSQYTQTRNDLMPYVSNSQSMLPALSNQYQQTNTNLTTAFNNAQDAVPNGMSIEQLKQTPGYQWNLDQGLKAVQNSAAAKGLGVSGAALKGAATYATGLADSTYQNQFNNQQTRFSDLSQQFSNAYNQNNAVYNQLYGPVALGQSAAAQSGVIGQQGAAQAGNNIAGAGQALAAGDLRAGNAYANGLNSVGQSVGNYYGTLNSINNSTALQNALRGNKS